MKPLMLIVTVKDEEREEVLSIAAIGMPLGFPKEKAAELSLKTVAKGEDIAEEILRGR